MKSGDPLAAWVLAAGLLAGCPVAPPRGGSTDEPPVRPAAPAAGPGEAPEEAPATADWPEAALAPTLRGVALLEQGRPVEAEPALAAAAEAGPGFAPVRFNLGLGRYLRGESPAGALAEFRAAAGLDPSLPGPRFGAACILEALGDTEGALKALEAARDLAPDEATVPFVRGRCLRRMGRPEEAIPHFGAATRLDPLLSSAWYALGQAEQAMGHAGPAREALAEFQRLRASGADRAWGSEYGEQGPLLVALEPTPLPGAWWPPVAPPEGARTARALADFDNDGLEDAFEDGWLFRRRDGGHLEPVLEQPATAVAFGDADHDGDLDLYVGREGPDLLLVNSGGRGFLPAEGLPPVEGRTVAAVWSDIDNDRDLDLVALRAGAPAALLYNERLGRWRAEELETGPGTSLWVGDADGDGWMDLQAGERRFRNVGGRFRLDTGPRGSPPAGRRLEIRLRGRRSNRDGLGARLTLAAGRWRATAELQRPGPLIFQVPGERPLDYLRVRWPSGVLQVETGLSLPGEVLLEELDRKGTSCPILYAHDGERWRFVTDFLGGSAVGHLLAPGVWNTPDPDEQVKVPGALLAARDGRLRVLAVNQLEEVIWFDRFALLAVPHEPASEVHPDERLAATVEGMPSPRILETRDATSLAAVDGAGLDCSDLVRECDGRWPDGFRLLPYKGYGELHHLELDLGRLSPEGRQFLFLDAWIDYSDSTSNLAAAQAGVTCVPPRLEVPDGRGGWRVALEDLGFPAGLTKTMTREVTGLWDPADPRLRIVTNLRIYWDRVRAGHALEVPPGRTRRARPVGARLFRLGYPRGYDANDCAPDELWARHAGTYTPLGDVLALLREADDRFVTTMNGDAIELTFTADALLAGIPEGHTVDFVLQTEGFGKDMDLNSAVPFTVDPLPFHGMTAYPPPLPAAPLEEAWAGRRVESLEEGLDWRRARQGGIR